MKKLNDKELKDINGGIALPIIQQYGNTFIFKCNSCKNEFEIDNATDAYYLHPKCPNCKSKKTECISLKK